MDRSRQDNQQKIKRLTLRVSDESLQSVYLQHLVALLCDHENNFETDEQLWMLNKINLKLN